MLAERPQRKPQGRQEVYWEIFENYQNLLSTFARRTKPKRFSVKLYIFFIAGCMLITL